MSSSSQNKFLGPFRWIFLLAMVYLSVSPANGIQACGKHLNEILILTCGGVFPTLVKKSSDPLDYYSEAGTEDDLTWALDRWPFLNSFASNSLTKTRRRRLGIVHECCDKQCSVSELKSYCKRSV